MSSMKNWQKQLMDARNLSVKSGQAAYKVATILVSVFNDAEFRDDNGFRNDTATGDFLSRYSSYGSFWRLRDMLERFPDVEVWKDRTLGEMEDALADSLESDRKAKQAEASRDRKAREIARNASRPRDDKTGVLDGSRVAPPTVARQLAKQVAVEQVAFKTLADELSEAKAVIAKVTAERDAALSEAASLRDELTRVKRQLRRAKSSTARLAAAM